MASLAGLAILAAQHKAADELKKQMEKYQDVSLLGRIGKQAFGSGAMKLFKKFAKSPLMGLVSKIPGIKNLGIKALGGLNPAFLVASTLLDLGGYSITEGLEEKLFGRDPKDYIDPSKIKDPRARMYAKAPAESIIKGAEDAKKAQQDIDIQDIITASLDWENIFPTGTKEGLSTGGDEFVSRYDPFEGKRDLSTFDFNKRKKNILEGLYTPEKKFGK